MQWSRNGWLAPVPDRKTVLKGAGSLIGQAAAHGALYGQLHRERLLYENEAQRRLGDVGQMNEAEWQVLRQAAARKGRRQINEAFAKGKPTAAVDLQAAQVQLAAEIDAILDELRPLH